MRKLSQRLPRLCSIAAVVAATGGAQAASGNGPYYALPAWDQSLPAASRFVVLTNMESMAVLDRETGLVWEKRPGWGGGKAWVDAMTWCDSRVYVYRMGWRLPTVQEMSSLMGDVSVNGAGVSLQPGHPFDLTLLPPAPSVGELFWTSTPDPRDPSSHYVFEIRDRNTGTQIYGFSGDWRLMVWCVRGPGGLPSR